MCEPADNIVHSYPVCVQQDFLWVTLLVSYCVFVVLRTRGYRLSYHGRNLCLRAERIAIWEYVVLDAIVKKKTSFEPCAHNSFSIRRKNVFVFEVCAVIKNVMPLTIAQSNKKIGSNSKWERSLNHTDLSEWKDIWPVHVFSYILQKRKIKHQWKGAETKALQGQLRP